MFINKLSTFSNLMLKTWRFDVSPVFNIRLEKVLNLLICLLYNRIVYLETCWYVVCKHIHTHRFTLVTVLVAFFWSFCSLQMTALNSLQIAGDRAIILQLRMNPLMTAFLDLFLSWCYMWTCNFLFLFCSSSSYRLHCMPSHLIASSPARRRVVRPPGNLDWGQTL